MYGKQALLASFLISLLFEKYVILYGKQASTNAMAGGGTFEKYVILYGKQASTESKNALYGLRSM